MGKRRLHRLRLILPACQVSAVGGSLEAFDGEFAVRRVCVSPRLISTSWSLSVGSNPKTAQWFQSRLQLGLGRVAVCQLFLSSLCVSLYFFSQYVASSSAVFLVHSSRPGQVRLRCPGTQETLLAFLGGVASCDSAARSKLLRESVVEFLHGDAAVSVVVELAHEHVLLVVGHVDVQPIYKAHSEVSWSATHSNKSNIKKKT